MNTFLILDGRFLNQEQSEESKTLLRRFLNSLEVTLERKLSNKKQKTVNQLS